MTSSRGAPLHRALASLVVLVAVVAIVPQVFGAATASIHLSPTTAQAGSTVAVSGTGFDRRVSGSLTFDGSATGMPTFTTTSNGHFSTSFTVPATALPGAHTVRASTAGATASATLTVTLMATPTPTPTPTATPTPTPTATPTPTPSATPTATPPPTSDPNDIGTRDQGYPSTVFAPTGQKPQSKLWYNAGGWWGVLFNGASNRFEIYGFDWSANHWTTTGVAVDTRPGSSADALWDGSHLFIVSALADLSNSASPPTSGDRGIQVMRFSYSGGSWSLDAGFPVTVATAAVEAAVIDEDSTGMLWLTWTYSNGSGGRNVLVTHSTTDTAHWAAPYVLPVSGTTNLTPDDISAVVAYRGRIGIMWSNQTTGTVGFASHADGASDQTWTLNPAVQGPNYADDHISLRSLAATPSGEIVAATKTSLDDVSPGSTQPLILVLTLDSQGSWHRSTFGTVQDGHTRPIVVVDSENDVAYVFATVNSNTQTVNGVAVNGGTITYKTGALPNPTFASGQGTPFLRLGASSTSLINNPTSTKQAVTSASGLLIEASDDGVRQYMHNRLSIQPASQPTPPVATYHFEEGSGTAIVDGSGNGNNGTTRGAPTWITGHSGLAIHLNGSTDWCVIPTSSSLDIHGPLTLSAWIRPERVATGYIVKKATLGSVDGYELSLSSTGKVFVRFNQATSANTYRIDSTTSYPVDGVTWMHVAATYDGTTLRLYINGTQEGSLTAPAPASNSVAVGIGAQADGVSPIQGAIDEVNVWNRALSSSEIQGLVGS